MLTRTLMIVALLAWLLVGACGGAPPPLPDRAPDDANLDAPCVKNADCVNSFCDNTGPEGPCKVASDCGGYVATAMGYRPPSPNKRCIDGVCHQVGVCSNHHS